jgi:hypothetical protein
MGLKSENWKKILYKYFNGEKVFRAPLNITPDKNRQATGRFTKEDNSIMIIEDFNIAVHEIFSSKNFCPNFAVAKDILLHRFRRYISSVVRANALSPSTAVGEKMVKKICILFDNGHPINKQETQQSRDKYNQKKMLSDKQIFEIFCYGNQTVIEQNEVPIEEFRATRKIFPFLVFFICRCIKAFTKNDLGLKWYENLEIEVISGIEDIEYAIIDKRTNELLPFEEQSLGEHSELIPVLSRKNFCIQYPRNTNESEIYEHDATNYWGEAEVNLIGFLMRDGDYTNYYLKCKDTDIIPLILLALKDTLNEQGEFAKEIFVDLKEEVKTGEENTAILRNCFHANELWKEIYHVFGNNWPQVNCPVEFLISWMILMGTDYVEGISGLDDAEKFFKFFTTHGYEIIRQSKEPVIPTFGINDIGIWDRPKHIIFAEHIYYQMVIAYHAHYPESWMKDVKYNAKQETLATLKLKAPKAKQKYLPKNDEHVYSHIRRANWNINYWSNTVRSPCYYAEPIATQEHTGMPVYGWILDASNNKCTKSDVVC